MGISVCITAALVIGDIRRYSDRITFDLITRLEKKPLPHCRVFHDATPRLRSQPYEWNAHKHLASPMEFRTSLL